MGRIRVLIAAEVSRSLKVRIEADQRFDVTYRPMQSEEELQGALQGIQVLVTRHYNAVSPVVMDAGTSLELIAQGTSGLDNIDLTYAARRGIAVADAAGENANAVAELVIANMIALTRTVPLYQKMMREGQWSRADCDSRHELRAHRLGIVGIGRVGRRVAALASLFGVAVTAYDPYVEAAEVGRRGATKVDSLEQLLEGGDILTLHVPLTAETTGMLGSAQLDLLPRGSFVINASRGEVVSIADVAARINDGRLGGGAFDVFHSEPPSLLPDDPRMIFTPHIAGCSFESKEAIGSVIYEKICRHFAYEPLTL